MVAGLRPSVVRHGVVVGLTVWQIRAHEEELEAGQQRRKHPVQHDVYLADAGSVNQNVIQCPIPDDLSDGGVAPEETEEPRKQFVAAVKVGVEVVVSRVGMMQKMVAAKARIRHAGKQPRGNGANASVDALAAVNRAMHSIMGCYEQAGVQKGLQQHMMDGKTVDVHKAPRKMAAPRQNDDCCNENTHDKYEDASFVAIMMNNQHRRSVLLTTAVAIMLAWNAVSAVAQKLLIPMDLTQTNHLKAYGIAYWALTKDLPVDWLLNYRGGSFMLDAASDVVAECRIRGVRFEQLDGGSAAAVYADVQSERNNTEVVRLEKAPRIAVYVPPGFLPWDDAVTLAMEYAEVKYDKLWDDEVLDGKLSEYDWLHLHHEDFTGQYGKFFSSAAGQPWYVQQVALLEATAAKHGFAKVTQLKLAVVEKIRDYVANGGFMFAMCSATDTYDVALAAAGTDIADAVFDGDGVDPAANDKLDFTRTFAFENFRASLDPYEYEYSSIDIESNQLLATKDSDYFTLFDFSAKYDPVPTMLTQCHVNVVRGFLGQTTAFHKQYVKKSVTVLAEREGTDQVKYIHGNVGRGTFTWYGGHDPEDYQHYPHDPPTDLALHTTSPGYRLILNNILFPAAKKKKQKT